MVSHNRRKAFAYGASGGMIIQACTHMSTRTRTRTAYAHSHARAHAHAHAHAHTFAQTCHTYYKIIQTPTHEHIRNIPTYKHTLYYTHVLATQTFVHAIRNKHMHLQN